MGKTRRWIVGLAAGALASALQAGSLVRSGTCRSSRGTEQKTDSHGQSKSHDVLRSFNLKLDHERRSSFKRFLSKKGAI